MKRRELSLQALIPWLCKNRQASNFVQETSQDSYIESQFWAWGATV